MKKAIQILLLLSVLALVLSACNNTQETSNQKESEIFTTTEITEKPTEKTIDFNESISNLKKAYEDDELKYSIDSVFVISSDGSSLIYQRKSEYDETSWKLVESINDELGFSAALFEKMKSTRAIDGAQTDENDYVKGTWTYHPKKDLKLFTKRNSGTLFVD